MIGREDKSVLEQPVMIGTIDAVDPVQEAKHQKLWKRIPCLGLILVLLRVTMCLIRQAGIKELVGINPLVYQIYQTMFSLSMSIQWSLAVDKGPFPPNEPRKVNGLIIFRGISSCLTTISVVFALQNMPIGTYSMVLATRPIFSLILAKVFLSEPFGIPEIFTMILLFSGIIFVVKPPFIFPQDLLEEKIYGENFS